VAIKRLHPALAVDRGVVAMLQQEACIAGRLHHPNVVATIDVVVEGAELYVVMEYVHGESLSRLLRFGRSAEPVAAPVASSIVAGVLRGLHAAHEAKGEHGEPLEILHHDVSPQNVLVGADGLARLIDFGIAHPADGPQKSASARKEVKGKLAYLAPEQVRGERATRQSDIYAAGVVLWETLAGRRLYHEDCEGALVEQILVGWVDPPSKYVPELPAALDAIALRALHARPSDRFGTAAEMADALELAIPPARAADVTGWVTRVAGEALAVREELLSDIEAVEGTPERRAAAALNWRAVAGVAAFAALASSVAAVSPEAPAVAEIRASGSSWPSAPVERSPGSGGKDEVDPAAIGAPPEPVASPPARAEGPRPASLHTTPLRRGVAIERELSPDPHDDCDPPYAVDSQGIRIYKRACLRR
jgi:serine/threonine-protein kinase